VTCATLCTDFQAFKTSTFHVIVFEFDTVFLCWHWSYWRT